MSAAMTPPRRIVRFIACAASFAGSLIGVFDLQAATPGFEPSAPEGSNPPMRCPAPSAVRDALVRDAKLPEPGVAPATPTALEPPDEEVEVSSDAATLGVTGDAALSGRVAIRQGNRTLSAEDVTYDAKAREFSMRGLLRYRDPVLQVEGRSGRYDPAGGAAFADTRFAMPEEPARGAADGLELGIDGKVTLSRVWFTTCPESSPDWRIRASRIELDTRARNGTGRSAAIEFKGVPILYLPYLSFPLGDQRKSGFLFPNVGYSSRGGAEIKLPYYLNLAPNYDLTLEPTLYGRRGVDLGTSFRYLTRAHRGDLRLNALQSDGIRDINRNWLRVRHRSELPAGWRFDVDAQSVSDAEYFEDFASGTEGTSTAFLQRSARLSYRDSHWYLRAEAEQFQTIDRALEAIDRPYARLPHVQVSGEWESAGPITARYGFDSEVVNFDREVGVEGWRTHFAPRVGLDVGSPAYYLRPSVGWRYTRYDLERAADAEDQLSRSLPYAALDTGLRLERNTIDGARTRMTLEPRLLYLWTPYRNQDDLPIFDTALPDLDFVQLFRTSSYVGPDRIADANHASIGVTSRIFDSSSGRQLLSATIGQTYRFDRPRVRLPGEPETRDSRSDLVAQLGISAWQNWNVNLGLQWDSEESRQQRSHVRLQYRPDTDRAVNVAYRFQRDRLEQGEVSGAWPLGPRWNAYGRFIYDLKDRSTLDRFAGLEYKSCCWRLRVVGRRFVSSRTGERDTGIYLQLELNGLASVGSSADAFLEEAIRGYSPVGLSR
ncbi:MAG: LPS-assembly protein LptD [Gammaproteobacteria bacterium]|jgi:LPS-assembly protein|nr:LPS-assembly protein LptD [Gammaproteobacteria bacterium]